MLLLLVACESGPDYGPYTPLVKSQLKNLENQPCSEPALRELVDLMGKGQRPQDAIAPMRTFLETCPPNEALRHLQLEVGTKAKDWAMALEAADALVAASPSERQPRLDRADARLANGDAAGAADDLRQAYLLDPQKITDDQFKKLAETQEKAGLPCDAWQTWRSVYATRRTLKGEAALHMNPLINDPACLGWRVEGESMVRRDEIEGWWLFPVTLDGKETRLGVDTSAAISIISRDTATALGVSTDGDPWFARSFQGTVAGPKLRIAQLGIGKLTLAGVDVLVVDRLPDHLPGMIGGDVLSRIRLTEDRGLLWKVEEW